MQDVSLPLCALPLSSERLERGCGVFKMQANILGKYWYIHYMVTRLLTQNPTTSHHGILPLDALPASSLDSLGSFPQENFLRSRCLFVGAGTA